jgi:hypothetical protein
MVKGDAIYPYIEGQVVLHLYDLSEGNAKRWSADVLNKQIGA